MREAMNAQHEYPADLRSSSIEGRVTLKLLISDTEAVETLSVEQSPHHELTKATQNGAYNLVIESGICSGAPTEMTIDFSLNYFIDVSY
ncbi:energy transducer TonB [Gracilimonas sp. Q87]|uniref:energy transducer TonB n=1 Tax=Gracilimonas sp. Q87 TaxID=3384766 RepID=UPI0039842490